MTQSTDQSSVMDPAELRRAVDVANVPTLLMVLYQLTGDEAWLQSPYLPTRTRGLDLHDTGGLDPIWQEVVRTAACDALLAWSNGAEPVVPAPAGELLVRMMSTCMGEPVDPDYTAMMAEDMGFAPEPVRCPQAGNPDKMSVIVIGAGVSGLLASAKLTQAGIRHVVLEKNEDVGGTWLDNRYPGCRVDTPSYVYTFSFVPNDWSTYFGKREDIWKYLSGVADKLQLRDAIHFGTDVQSAQYDTDAHEWVVAALDLSGGAVEYRARAVISAVGLLNVPHVPKFEGAEQFKGQMFHPARWPEGIDMRGKRVAVVGAGASSMQIVPAIADEVVQLTVYQRSPHWVAPNSTYFESVPEGVHWLMNNVPFYRAWYRFRLAWTFNDKAHPSLQIDPNWPSPDRSVNALNEGHRRYFERYLHDELEGRPDLVEKCLPAFPPFGKRMLLDNGWFRTIRKPNVELVVEGIARLTPTGVVGTDGVERPTDIIVAATGFEALRMLGQFEIRGKDGQSLRDVWGDENPFAYMGLTVPGFPNFFIMYGPNTNMGHGGSFIGVGECQIRYIVDAICAMVEGDIASMECRDDVCSEYNKAVDEAHAKMVWSHKGVKTYYTNSKGRVVTNSPWRVIDYWRMTHQVNLDDFHREPAKEACDRHAASG